MVLSIARARLRADDRPAPAAPAPEGGGATQALLDAPRGWPAERGTNQWDASADVVGGFPGSVASGGRLENATIRVTDRYLLVDEGRPHGFGLPLAALVDVAAPDGRDGAGDPVLRFAYRDGPLVRAFVVRLRGALFALRGARRAERALDALQAVGVPRRDPARPLSPPSLTVSWQEAGRFQGENVIWSGRATAPLAAGVERALADVWLTTRSLIWGGAPGDGVCRLPLDQVHDVVPGRLADRAGTPVVHVAYGAGGERHDLAFAFDGHGHGDRNGRERGAFLVGLRSRGIPLGVAAPPLQPWRLDVRPAVPLLAVPHRPVAAARDALPPPDPATVPWPAPPPAPTSATMLAAPVRPTTVVWPAPPLGSGTPNLPATAEAPSPGPISVDRPRGEPAPALPLARAYEADALACLAAVLRAVNAPTATAILATDGTPFPPSSRRTDALAELDAASAAGDLSPSEMGVRRARLLAFGETVPRLCSLLELRAAGYLSDDDLKRKRDAILAPLVRHVFGPDASP